jgi:putative transposase
VNGEWLIDDVAKEVLRRQIWQVSDYCGVNLVTYTILDNHFHVLVEIPQSQPISDAELLRRYLILYPTPTRYQMARVDVIAAELAQNGPRAVAWRRQQNALMGDVSQFMKLVKQRFSRWYNDTHDRFGTLWSERFKSTLLEPKDSVLQKMAAYIDLNSVRAGIVSDPKEYRFCGYAEAVAGNERAQNGISRMVGSRVWDDVQPHYRELLFGAGAAPREGKASISEADLQRVIAEGGKLPLPTVLRCRIRHFIDGAVLGSGAFVQAQLAAYHQKTGRCGRAAPRPLPLWTEWGDLTTLRRVRQLAIR